MKNQLPFHREREVGFYKHLCSMSTDTWGKYLALAEENKADEVNQHGKAGEKGLRDASSPMTKLM